MIPFKNKLGIQITRLKCCCGGTNELPCLCMIKETFCSKQVPRCLCFKLFYKQNNRTYADMYSKI